MKFVFDDALARRKASRDEEHARNKARLDDELAERQAVREAAFDRRKALRTLVNEFDGRLMEAAPDFHFRLRNLYSGTDPGWLNPKDEGASGYFYLSTVYRFLALFRLAVAFDQRAIYFEPEASEKSDLLFIRYAKAFQWAMTDVRLFRGTDYDNSEATAHFFRDELRSLSLVGCPTEEPLTYFSFKDLVVGNRAYRQLFDFFSGVSRTDDLRWDRLVVLDLLLMGLLSDVGYADLYQQTQADFDSTASQLVSPVIRTNLPAWLDGLQLGDGGTVAMIKAAVGK